MIAVAAMLATASFESSLTFPAIRPAHLGWSEHYTEFIEGE